MITRDSSGKWKKIFLSCKNENKSVINLKKKAFLFIGMVPQAEKKIRELRITLSRLNVQNFSLHKNSPHESLKTKECLQLKL